MTKVYCSVPERYVNPLFEVFDGGDFVLSSYRDIEEPDAQVQIFFAEPEKADEAKRLLADALSVVGLDASVGVAEIPDEDWKLSYRRHFKTEHVSPRIYTHPPWEPMPDAKDGEIVITLDPGMAFGTGKHETTKACLQYIDEIAGIGECGEGHETGDGRRDEIPSRLASGVSRQEPSSVSFLDMGCGSGILSIAAAKLGFSPVAGFDIDEEAVEASRENASANGVKVDYRVFALGKGAITLDESIEAAAGVYPDLALQGKGPAGEGPRFEPADVVVANILGPLLIAFADEIASYVKKTLVVSGILSELYPEVKSAFESRGFREVSSKTIGEWTTGKYDKIYAQN
jgi:ribosomal protein L11 methyltransferase